MFNLNTIKMQCGVTMISEENKSCIITLFGDSICVGQHVDLHKTWAFNLSTYLKKFKYKDIIVFNKSVNGNTTRQALERFYPELSSKKPTMILIQFGMNDCNFWDSDYAKPRVSKLAFKANLKEIIDKSLAIGVKTIFLGTNHPSLKGAFDVKPILTHSKVNEEYNEIIRDVYKEAIEEKINIILIDNEKNIKEKMKIENNSLSVYLLSDGVHLSAYGHGIYLEYVKNKIINILEKKI